MHFRAIIFLFLLFSGNSFSFIFAEESCDTGTLIISYETGDNAERLSRVRFLLISEDNEEVMYPKHDAYVEALDCNSRTVAIEHLPVGSYGIRFIIPNTDHLFDSIPDSTIEIVKNQVTRFDQSLLPRYATIKATYETSNHEKDHQAHPTITLEDLKGKLYGDSISGKLSVKNLNPGSYVLFFGPLKGYVTPQPKQIEVNAGAKIGPLVGHYLEEKSLPSESEDLKVADSVIISRPRGGVIINQVTAQVTVTSNMPNASWTLLRSGTSVYSAVGSVTNAQVPDGSYYSIIPEKIDGYSVRVNQPTTFPLYATTTTRISIIYERTYGTVNIKTTIPNNLLVTAHLLTPGSKPLDIRLQSRDGKINWVSQPLPTGDYTITYDIPSGYPTIPEEHFTLQNGERKTITPELFSKSVLRITSNIAEGVFVLRGTQDSKVWKGYGHEYSFINIPPGTYTLTFSTEKPEYYLPPKEMRIVLNNYDNKEVSATFQLAGKLVVTTNVSPVKITIQELGGQRKIIQDQISSNTKAFTLPEGRYRISVNYLQDMLSKGDLIAPKSLDANIRALKTEEITLLFQRSDENKPVEKSQINLKINANIQAASYTVSSVENGKQETIGKYFGKITSLDVLPGKHYMINFDDIPNFETPQNIEFDAIDGQMPPIFVVYEPLLLTVNIPQGKVILGAVNSQDLTNELSSSIVELKSFSVGVYEVTNREFASWLNHAIKDGSITYTSEGEKKGHVYDDQGRLVFKTFEADPYSQISLQQSTSGGSKFITIGGKDFFPVIDVSWYGATAYCKSNNCRLPTEAEWEMAAGMEKRTDYEAGLPLKKFIFGFSENHIDRTYANYKEISDKINETGKSNFQVLTTPVGFYNGINTLPLDINQKGVQLTHLAKSPYGAFDMSGNVWEWVSDWYADTPSQVGKDYQGPETGTQKVAKGGCYDSFADGVRVAERIGLNPEHLDVFTGFRIAM